MKKVCLKIFSLFCVSVLLLSLTACGGGTLKKPIPQPEYTSFGYAIEAEISGDKLTFNYALVGYKEEKIVGLYLDTIEKIMANEKSASTNKELGTAYGLGYESDLGEFNVQLAALENYIVGHKMTIEEVNEIETDRLDDQHTSVPKKGTDLAVACGLNIGKYLELINKASENLVELECMKIGLGEEIKIYNNRGEIIVPFAVVATDYNKKVAYSFLDLYKVNKGDTQVKSEKQKAKDNAEIAEWVKNVNGYEEYMIGRTVGEAAGVETYNTGDGITMNIPRPGTDLADVCNIDIGYFINVIYEASNRSK